MIDKQEVTYSVKRSDNKSGRKINTSLDHIPRIHELSFDPLLYPPSGNIATDEDFAFDETIQKLLPDFLDTRLSLQEQELERDQQGAYLRNLTRAEVSSLLTTGEKWAHYASTSLLLRKLKLSQERRRSHITPNILVASTNPLQQNRSTPEQTVPRPRVVDALEDIETTPFENSFLSRLQGTRKATFPSLIAVDWETITPWMCLMRDVRNHYSPERQQPIESLAPITYCTLQACHLNQIHDLLERVFWTGIDVSDSLEYSPERCTVVACYERLVVGVAILSSPQETYITYLAVKAGWDKAQIARTMLFYLIKMNPRRDITLHVSANNSAMLLYNQFGFKAEEFIAGFYDDYLDPASRASKNAFRLRLRQ
ncbi:Cysteine-rich protein 2-binding protein [Leucoagaricus sp. SymC.cos]|nr:Cysteine-rich protein 2-binding protein [Leucoagaricus sp. SymC.cos]